MKNLFHSMTTSKSKKMAVSAGILAGVAATAGVFGATQALTNTTSDSQASANEYYYNDYYGYYDYGYDYNYDYSQNYYNNYYTTYADSNYYTSSSSVTLANGNTAGETGTYAAQRMAELTGVAQSTWEYIIARESNGNPNAANASGASGLFQTMPGWGSTATVEDQIQSALNAYNAQGLAAWGL